MPENLAPLCNLTIEHEIAQLTLNRPDRLNAIDASMHEALRAALDRIESEHVGALILRGAGRGFCAGQDLAERAEALRHGEVDLHASLEQNYNPLLRRLAGAPFPVIAAVRGAAAGAGAALALNCDIVLAARSATFAFSFIRIGLGPDSGVSWTLPRLVGQAQALALTLTGEKIDAVEAHRIGLVWRVVDDDALDAEAQVLAQRLADLPRAAMTATKRRLRAGARLDFDDALNAERDEQAALARLPEYRAAVLAFANKRHSKP